MQGRKGGRLGISAEKVVKRRDGVNEEAVTTYPGEGECPNAEIDGPSSYKL